MASKKKKGSKKRKPKNGPGVGVDRPTKAQKARRAKALANPASKVLDLPYNRTYSPFLRAGMFAGPGADHS